MRESRMPGGERQSLQGKVALVAGASAGIGRAAALMMAQEGADVAINYLTYPESASELAGQIKDLGRRALLCPADVSDQAAVESMAARIVAELGRLDILRSNAVYSERDFFYQADMAGLPPTPHVALLRPV